MSETPRSLGLSEDAAIVLALAETAVPFASSEQDEAERWVRVLRMHGQVGSSLQALGVGEAPLESPAQPPAMRMLGARPPGQCPVDSIAQRAGRFASGRGSNVIATVDILFAVFQAYGGTFDRELYVRGTTREELIERLAGSLTESNLS
jgi:hypothetical protein